MSEIRFSIETTYIDTNNTFISRTHTFGDRIISNTPSHDAENAQIENDHIPEIFDTGVENTISMLEAFFLFREMMYMESRLLERAMRVSSAENELQRDNTKHIDVTLRKYQEEGEKECTCVICSDKFIAGKEVCVLSCDHIFHKHCIEEWGHYKAECPLCKKSIPLVKENIHNDKDGIEENNKDVV